MQGHSDQNRHQRAVLIRETNVRTLYEVMPHQLNVKTMYIYYKISILTDHIHTVCPIFFTCTPAASHFCIYLIRIISLVYMMSYAK